MSNACDLSDDVIVILHSFSLLFLSFFFAKISPSFLAFEKLSLYLIKFALLTNIPNRHTEHTQIFSFSLFREGRLTDYNTHRGRIIRHLSLSHTLHDVIHVHYYEFHAKRAITTSVGSVRTEPATSSRDFNHKGSFSKSFFKERERERDE